LQSSGLLTPEGESPFVAVAAKVRPAVVNITAKKKQGRSRGDDFFNFGPFRDFFPHPDIPRGVTSGGSGIIVDRDGYILTNNHVVGGASEIKVKDAEGHEYDASIVGSDDQTDVALIKIADAKFSSEQVAELGNSDDIKIGDWAIAIGNPFGLDWTVTVGVISAKGRSNLYIAGGGPTYQDFIQTDASINFGNSGGPLVNIRGQVIGVNTAVNTQGQGIGFAIPANLAKHIVEQLRSSGQVTRGYLGLVPRDLDDATREALKIERDVKGVFVDQVEDGTPADKGGLKAGDVITQVNGSSVSEATQFRFMIAEAKPGANVTLTVLRDGRTRDMKFELGDRKEFASTNPQSAEPEMSWLGLQVSSLSSPQARQWQIDAAEGAVVVDIDFDSPAEGKLQPGDVIIEINRRPIRNLSDYRKIASELADTKEAILFRIIRDGRKTYEAVKP
ncbi:MAG TPA: Do family serine endopeptidase, partial [bacterium]